MDGATFLDRGRTSTREHCLISKNDGETLRASNDERFVCRQAQPQRHATILDPSDKYRPEPVYSGKLESQFRDYSEDPTDPVKERVRRTYHKMHANQTVEFVQCE